MDPVQHVLNIFEQLSAIPRSSGNEAHLATWLQSLARERGFSSSLDEVGNLVIRIPATVGCEAAPIVVVQGHMDMVCEKTLDSPHNFLTDPIRCIVDGDWMHADRTTLGADNGIAVALALALAADPSVQHPALELLFTVEEEVKLSGAKYLKPDFLAGKILVNLDSEEEGTFVVGCAGGQTTNISLPLVFKKPAHSTAFHLKVSGLRGGHSGVDIHKHYASANKLLARVLDHLQQITPLALMSLQGGTAHNAISREASASFVAAADKADILQQAVEDFETVLKNEFSPVDGSISLVLVPQKPEDAASETDSARAIQLLMALPHGVAEMSASVEGFVETSCNLASVEINSSSLKVITSQRSTVMSRMSDLTGRITAIGQLAGAEVVNEASYPSWEPDMKSQLLQRSIETYRAVFGHAPEVRMIHAGLECGTIGSIYTGMQMISLGVTIENPHSPIERMYIPSIERVWRYLVAFLQA